MVKTVDFIKAVLIYALLLTMTDETSAIVNYESSGCATALNCCVKYVKLN